MKQATVASYFRFLSVFVAVSMVLSVVVPAIRVGAAASNPIIPGSQYPIPPNQRHDLLVDPLEQVYAHAGLPTSGSATTNWTDQYGSPADNPYLAQTLANDVPQRTWGQWWNGLLKRYRLDGLFAEGNVDTTAGDGVAAADGGQTFRLPNPQVQGPQPRPVVDATESEGRIAAAVSSLTPHTVYLPRMMTPPYVVEVTIPLTGGTLIAPEYGFTLTVPPNYYSEPLRFRFIPTTPPNLPGMLATPYAFNLSATTLSGQPVTQFLHNLNLIQTYDPSILTISPEDYFMAYQNNQGKWIEVTTNVNTTNHTFTALTDHFTSFSVIANAPLCDYGVGEFENMSHPATPRIIAAYQAAGMIDCPLYYAEILTTINTIEYAGQEFPGGIAIVDNPNNDQAVVLSNDVWSILENEIDELGGPLGQQPSAPNHYIDGNGNNFRNQEIWYFDYGFISPNNGTSWEAHHYYPQFLSLAVSWVEQPISPPTGRYSLSLLAELEPNPAAELIGGTSPVGPATANVTLIVEAPNGTTYSVPVGTQGPSSIPIDDSTHYYFPTETLKIYLQAERVDGLIGYAPCNYYEPNPGQANPYQIVPTASYYFEYDCAGIGTVDSEPPDIEILQVYGTKIPGSNRLSVSALFRITDEFGIASMDATISQGVVSQPLAPYADSLYGADVYAVVFTDVPESTPVTITVGATDNSGLSAEESFEGYFVDGLAYGFSSCVDPCDPTFGYTGKTGNPVSTQTGYKTETFPLLFIPGPGEADINLTLVYNSPSIRTSIFGMAFSSDLGTHIVPLYNPLVPGVEVVIGDGGRFRFLDNGDGTFAAASQGNEDTLVKEGDGYLYTTHDQRRYRFDADGRLLARLDRNGNAVVYGYSNDQLTTINTGDHIVTLTYNADGYVATISIEDKVVTLTYTGNVLTEIAGALMGDYTLAYDIRPIGEIIDERGEDYAYEASQYLLTSVTTANGRIKNSQTYDAQGRVDSQISSLEGVLTFNYIENPDGTRETQILDTYGVPEIHYYNALGQLERVRNRELFTEYYFYNTNYQLERKIDFNGAEWLYDRDSNGNITETNGPEGLHEEWIYNEFNLPTYHKDGDGFEWRWFYDANGNLIRAEQPDPDFPVMTISYDPRGLPTNIVDYNGNELINTYDPVNGDLMSTRDGEGGLTQYTYDEYGRLHTVLRPTGGLWRYEYDLDSDQLTDLFGPLSYHAQYVYNHQDHLLMSEIDADGNETEYQYDNYFRLTDAWDGEENHTEFTYGSMNELLQVENARGIVTHYTYDDNRRVIQIDMAYGTSELITNQFVYDGLGNVVFAIDGEGRVTASEYDGLSRMTRLVQNYVAGGPVNENTNVITLFEHDYRRNVTQITNPLSDVREMTYDGLSRLIKLVNEENEPPTIYDHDGNGNLTLIHYPEGNEIIMEYNGRNQLKFLWDGENFKTEYRYDGNGNLTGVIAPDLIETRHEYNLLDQRIKTTENFVTAGPVDDQQNVVTLYAYSAMGDLTFVRDAEGFEFTYLYDGVHRLEKEINPEGEIEYFYDEVGNLKRMIDANDHEWLYTYDNHNRLIRDTNPEGHFAEYGYDKANNLISVRDRRGHVTTTEYDRLNRPVLMTAPAPLSYETQMSYDALGNLLTLTDGNGHTTSFEYDKVQRLTARIDAEAFRQEYEYDDNGRLVLSRIPFADPADTIEEEYEYDGRDLMILNVNGEDEETAYTYNSVGLLEAMTENDGVVTRYGYDGLRRLNQVILNYVPSSPAVGDKNVAFHYRYDGVGNLESIVDPLNHETTFDYNGLRSLIYEQNPLGNEWFYDYDPVQNLTYRQDANGETTLYSYFDDNQLDTIDYPDDPDVHYFYNENNNPTEMQDGLGTTFWVYDVLNRVTAVTDSLGREVEYEYDAINRRAITYPDGRTVDYTYLDNDWMETVADPVGGVSQYSYDVSGRVTGVAHPNNTYATYAYDRASRLLSLENFQDGGDVLSSFSYEYDLVGQRTQATMVYGWRNSDVVVEDYSYDGLRRLTGVTTDEGMVATYGYDRASNRTLWQTNDDPFGNSPNDGFTATYAYNAANQLLTADIERTPASQSEFITFTYDANGNRTNKLVDGNGSDEGMAYTYDDENRLVSGYAYLRTGNGNINWQAETRMAYDGNGRRLVESYDPHAGDGGLKRTEYTFDGLDTIAEYDQWNNHQRNYYRGRGNEMIQLHHFPAGSQGQQYWYHHNGHGDIAGLTKQNGQSTHNYRYDAYGGVIPANGNWTQPHNEYTLTEKAYDNHTGLHYFGARYYDSLSASWLTQDTYRGLTVRPVDLHRYLYVFANPINYFDVYGYFGWDDLKKAGDWIADKASDASQKIVEGAEKAVDWAKENQDVIAKVAMTGAAIVGTGLLCGLTAGVGCVVGAGLIAAASSYGTQVVDNSYQDGQWHFNKDTLWNDIDWTQVAIEGLIGAGGAGLGIGLNKLANPKIIQWCAGKGTKCIMAVKALLDGGVGMLEQMTLNALDECKALFDDLGVGFLEGSLTSLGGSYAKEAKMWSNYSSRSNSANWDYSRWSNNYMVNYHFAQ